MKIAVVLFGQPRFYKETAISFNREFRTFFNHEVDVFAHLWDNVGYKPEDDWFEKNNKLSGSNLKEDFCELYQPKGIMVENPDEKFNGIAKSLSDILETYREERLENSYYPEGVLGRKKIITSKSGGCGCGNEMDCCLTSVRSGNDKILRYEMGQFYSISRAMELKESYERQNNFEYDLVIRVRTDGIYTPPEYYENKKEYAEQKEKYYTHLDRHYEGVGIFGHGLKIVKGYGNGQHDPRGKRSDEYHLKLQSISFKDGAIESALVDVRQPEINISNFLESVNDMINEQGLFVNPWKLHFKDWIMYADNETANRAWSGMITTYTTIIFNDITRFITGKNLAHMPVGEVINGTSILLNNAKACSNQTVLSRVDKKQNDFSKMRFFKVVHLDGDKRKGIFKTATKRKESHCIECGNDREMKNRAIKNLTGNF